MPPRQRQLNIGCGDCYAPGWVNVDFGTPHKHDITADITKRLPFPDNTFDRLYAGHVLEHLEPVDVVVVLRELGRVATKYGQLAVVGPDVTRAGAMHAAGTLDDEFLRQVVHGGDRWQGDQHLWPSTPERTVRYLRVAGWALPKETPLTALSQINWPVVAYTDWQFAATAYAPGSVAA